MKTLSKAAEAQLLTAVRDVVSHVDRGVEPTAAVVKVACAMLLPRGHISLLCNAYNTGRVNAQRKMAADSIMERFEDMPLADHEKAAEQIWPSQVETPAERHNKSAVSDTYSSAPHWLTRRKSTQPVRKVSGAEPVPPIPALGSKKEAAWKTIIDGGRHLQDVRPKSSAARDQMVASLQTLTGYFKKANCISFPEVHYAVASQLGGLGDALMQLVGTQLEIEKTAAGPSHDQLYDMLKAQGIPLSDDAELAERKKQTGSVVAPKPASILDGRMERKWHGGVGPKPEALRQALTEKGVKFAVVVPKVMRSVDWSQQPYSLVKEALAACDRAVDARRELVELEAQIKSAREEVYGPSGAHKSGSTKAAVGGSLFGNMALGAGIGAALPKPKTPGEQIESTVTALDDPDHESAMRNIQISAMLRDMMSNDEVIRGYEPEEVLHAYNQIAQTAPTVAMHSIALGPELRSVLQRNRAPHETAQLVSMEKDLRGLRPPTGPHVERKESK